MKERTVIAALAAVGRLDGEEAWLLGRSARRAGIGSFEQMMQAVARGYRAEKDREVSEADRQESASNLATIPRENLRFPLSGMSSGELERLDQSIGRILGDNLDRQESRAREQEHQ